MPDLAESREPTIANSNPLTLEKWRQKITAEESLRYNKRPSGMGIREWKKFLKKGPAPCHPLRPLFCKELCHSCYRKANMKAHPEWQVNNNERARAKWHSSEEYRKKRYLATRRAYLAKQYGLTLEQYDKLLERHDGCCWICRRPPNRKLLAVDHSHKTGRVRGLLCARCNRGIASFYDDPVILENAADYLSENDVEHGGEIPYEICDQKLIDVLEQESDANRRKDSLS